MERESVGYIHVDAAYVALHDQKEAAEALTDALLAAVLLLYKHTKRLSSGYEAECGKAALNYVCEAFSVRKASQLEPTSEGAVHLRLAGLDFTFLLTTGGIVDSDRLRLSEPGHPDTDVGCRLQGACLIAPGDIPRATRDRVVQEPPVVLLSATPPPGTAWSSWCLRSTSEALASAAFTLWPQPGVPAHGYQAVCGIEMWMRLARLPQYTKAMGEPGSGTLLLGLPWAGVATKVEVWLSSTEMPDGEAVMGLANREVDVPVVDSPDSVILRVSL